MGINFDFSDPLRVNFGMAQVMPILVIPMTATTAAMLIHYGITKKCFTDILPLLVIQLNSSFIWTISGCYWIYIPYLRAQTSVSHLEMFLLYSFTNAIILDPINTSLYTWRFLDTFEQEQ